jgi:protein SCO1/2
VSPNAPRRNAVERLFGNPLVLFGLALVIFGSVTYASLTRESALEPLPKLGQVPSFELVDQTGRAFGTEQLEGKVWIANFIFTRCPTVCPVFSQKMKKVQKRTRNLGLSVMLVSFSVDPEWDTSARLAEYATKFSANPNKWKFLTGTPESVRLTVREGLKIAMENEGMTGDVPDIIHGTHFVLIDRFGQIRGYFDSDDAEAIDRMVLYAGELINHPD